MFLNFPAHSRLGHFGAIFFPLMASDIQILPSNPKMALLLSFSVGQSTKPPERCSPITPVSSERFKMILSPDYWHFSKGRKMLASLQDRKHAQERRLIWERWRPLLCLWHQLWASRPSVKREMLGCQGGKLVLLPVSAPGGPLKFETQEWPDHHLGLLRWKLHTMKMSCWKSCRCRMHVEDKYIPPAEEPRRPALIGTSVP